MNYAWQECNTHEQHLEAAVEASGLKMSCIWSLLDDPNQDKNKSCVIKRNKPIWIWRKTLMKTEIVAWSEYITGRKAITEKALRLEEKWIW